MGCKNKNTYFNRVKEEKREEKDGREERELTYLYYFN